LRAWRRRRQFRKAYHILENEAARHQKAGHSVVFMAVGPNYIKLHCPHCPDQWADPRDE
jgi:hypothetical protein